MIETGIVNKVKIQDVISNQLPNFILDESPLTVDFLQQYYASQEYQGGAIDIVDNLDQYLNIDNLTPEVVVDSSVLAVGISSTSETIQVSSTKGFPNKYGLLKIDNEIITYTGITTNSFTGCKRGFSGITSYHADLKKENLVFSTSDANSHDSLTSIQNLSTLFLKEFYNKFKKTFTPGLENKNFQPDLDVGTFIREARSLYQAKGTDESFRILFNVLYGLTPKILNLEEKLIKPSTANYVRRQVCVAELLSGNPVKLRGQTLLKGLTGQTLFRSDIDNDINASISEIEPFERVDSGQSGITTYYKIGLFVGYDETSNVKDDFVVVPNTKSLETVSIGASVINVDSTIGFGTAGTIIAGVNTITYGSKTVNQFLDCAGITSTISPIENIRSNITYFGYEDGDLNKKVVLRLTGVISDFEQVGDIDVDEGEIFAVKSIGDKVLNPSSNKSYKEIFCNSWIYNTSSSYFIDGTPNTANIKLLSKIDRSSLKVGDRVEIVERSSNRIVYPLAGDNTPYIDSIDETNNTVSLKLLVGFTPSSDQDYKLRKKLNKASSSGTPIEYGNDSVISDIQNVYLQNEDENAFVASNSLPSHVVDANNNKIGISRQIDANTKKIILDENNNVGFLTGILESGLSTVIVFDTDVPFKTGDEIFYTPNFGPSLVGLDTGIYYVDVISSKRIKLYGSPAGIELNKNLEFTNNTVGISSHKFILNSQKSDIISPQRLIKKFPLKQDLTTGIGESTEPGQTGMLINGVEITNYKSNDKIYFGPLEKIDVLNGGENFDVINLPSITVSTGIGTTALVQPVVKGKIEKVFVDPQNFDIDKIVSIGITGGNGSGCVIEPVLGSRFREELFNPVAREGGNASGINSSTNQIIFFNNHNFIDGEPIIYNSKVGTGIGVGVGTATLIDGATYYPRVNNNRTIRIYETFDDFSSDVNPINLNGGNAIGEHGFKVGLRNTLLDVKLIDQGSEYTNRKLIVKQVGINTFKSTINFDNHGFSSGEIINYSTEGNLIAGLSTSKQYQILKIDNNSFRLCDAGIGGTVTSNFERGEFVKFTSKGSGFQNFAYPDISGFIEFIPVGVGTTAIVNIEITPKVRGSIEQLYLYESGTGYGSTIINNHNKPIITLKNGKNAQLKPIIVNGKLSDINLQFGGSEYFSIPDIELVDPTGSGTGASIRLIIENQKISGTVIANAGIGYSTSSFIKITSAGKNQYFDSSVRPLTLNLHQKLNVSNQILQESNNNLKYSVSGYTTSTFNDDGASTSNIIGWAYDGNPIYGPYGFADPNTSPSDAGTLKRLESSYVLKPENIFDRPDLTDGDLVEDYVYDNSADLDEHNGRYERTPEFPNGVYAYHATVDNINNPVFPYFIGNVYKSKFIDDNKFLLQTNFDFNQNDLLRNTFPHKVADENANNDFIVETNEIEDQKVEIESISSGSITGFNILNKGINFKVGDSLNFDSTGTGGEGLLAKVSSVEGVGISSVSTSTTKFSNAVLEWSEDNITVSVDPNHNFDRDETVILSGLSTDISKLNDSFNIGVTSFTGTNISSISGSPIAGFTTEIYVSTIPSVVSAGGSIGIGTETLKILNIYKNINVLTVQRDNVSFGTTHPLGTLFSYTPDSFTIDKKISYFESTKNKKVFFNPAQTIGIGTDDGTEHAVSFPFAGKDINRNIPIGQIYLENHPFKNNQKIKLSIPAGSPNISISTDRNPSIFNLPDTLFVVNKTVNTIGIKTGIGSTFKEVYFRNINSADSDLYLFETDFDQVTCDVEQIKTTVTTPVDHDLSNGDHIDLVVKPNLSVGIGTSTSIRLLRDELTGNILLNPILFSNTGIDTSSNKINILDHGLKTGQKVKYTSNTLPEGLQNKNYFVYRVDDNHIKLSETIKDSTSSIPNTIGIGSTGGTSQSISLINPEIISIRDNDLTFDLSDSSISGYNLKFYYDQNFKNEFLSSGVGTNFNISSVGTAVTIGYGSSLPNILYYNLEKSGTISTTDTQVSNYSKINFENSAYSNNYQIKLVTPKSFDIFLQENPEKLTYNIAETNQLSYTTNSKSAKGGIELINIVSPGTNYKKVPTFSGVSTFSSGTNASIIPTSKTVGNVEKIRIINEGFEYSSDKTLEPESLISTTVEIKNSNTLGIVSVTYGGSGFVNEPNLDIISLESGQKIDSGFLLPIMLENSIFSVDITEPPLGLPETGVFLRTSNNSNGIVVTNIESNAGSSYTCTLTTPLAGFAQDPFSTGDLVFIEGVEKVGAAGSGFNSSDYGFNFLPVKNYFTSGGLSKIEIDVSSFTNNTGIAKSTVTTFATVVNQPDYPTFFITQNQANFVIDESISVNSNSTNFKILSTRDRKLKIFGKEDLEIGDVIFGEDSGSQAEISKISRNKGRLKTDFSILKNVGWKNNIGMLSDDIQYLPDNDYYQNMSYSVQSPIEWNKLQTSVNNILHTSGMKNFADTGITSTTNVGIGSTSTLSLIVDLIGEKRVDEIKNIDTVKDVDVSVGNIARFVEFDNIRLSDYIQCNTNDVLDIDDINHQFSNLEGNLNTHLDLFQFGNTDVFNNFLVRVDSSSSNANQIQLSDIMLLSTGTENVIVEKARIINSGVGLTNTKNDSIVEFKLHNEQSTQIKTLRFTPLFPNDTDYDLKIFNSTFNTSTTGFGTTSLGPINLSSFISTCGSGVNTSIVSVPLNHFESLHATTQITDLTTNEINLVETYVTHSDSDTFLSESYFNTDKLDLSLNKLGIVSSSISNNNLVLNFENNTSNIVRFKSKVIGIGTTGVNDFTYRFKAQGQPDGQERFSIYQSTSNSGVGTADIVNLSSSLFNSVKSIVEVSIGSSKAIHEILSIHDGVDAYIHQSKFLSVSKNFESEYDPGIGLGTFSASYDAYTFSIKFHPDNLVGVTTVVSLNHCFYTDVDRDNTPQDLTYGGIVESNSFLDYNALNGERVNRTDFLLRNNSIDIFGKVFNPNSSDVNLGTGQFTLKNHFFRPNEELIYKPSSTFVGVGSTAMLYKSAAGIHTLPSSVFVKTVTNANNFTISTTRAGAAVTFMSAGEGNAHEFSMAKSNEKALIGIDDVIQYPMIRSDVTHTIANNVAITTNIIHLSGLSTITSFDVLKVNDEFMRIKNIGFGTTASGPISLGGTFGLVEVDRGFVGTSATTHDYGDLVRKFGGSYNIVGRKIFFVDAPRGNPAVLKDNGNLDFPTSKFHGRVYLRNDYSTNQIYDDISTGFNGITSSFTLKVGGANTVGLGTTGGNGILFINGIFQSPSTDNNPNQNFKIIETGSGASGVTSVKFTGIQTSDGTQFISGVDINENEIPRGGIPVSVGSTVTGLGYAPLVGAKVKALLGIGGTISSIVGVAYSGSALGIVTATYNEVSGIMTIKTVNEHPFVNSNEEVILGGLEFACAAPHSGVTTTIFPDGTIGDKFPIVSIAATNVFGVNIGVCTIPHAYVGSGNAFPWYGDLRFGSGYNGLSPVGVAVTDLGYEHRFVSADNNAISKSGGSLTPTNATYDPTTGILVVTANNHGMNTNDNIVISPGSIRFSCSKDNFKTVHGYPRLGDPAYGSDLAITKITNNVFSVDVGKNIGTGANITASVGVGGSLAFTIVGVGTNYQSPIISVPEPSYSNLSVRGVSRLGIGQTTDTGIGLVVNALVSASSTTGIGSTLFEITGYDIVKRGYGYKKGDIVEAIGIVTDGNLSQAVVKSTLEITDVYKDSFAMWQFGEFDYIDSIKNLQDGERTKFPLFYNGSLVSIEAGDSLTTDIENSFFITVNGIIQEPKSAYNLVGGTSINFEEAPAPGDEIAILFYKGTDGVDSRVETGESTVIERGDNIQIVGLNTTPTQDRRTVISLDNSKRLETNVYSGLGIDDVNSRSVSLIKQKEDLILNKEFISKKRSQLEPRITPVAKIIKDFSTSDTEFFVDNADFFNYEEDPVPNFSCVIVSGKSDPEPPSFNVTIDDSDGSVSAITIVNPGSGYVPSSNPVIKFTAPPGVGTTAVGGTLVGASGTFFAASPTTPGSGYTSTNPPQTIVELPSITLDNLNTPAGSNLTIQSVSGSITGIGTTLAGGKLAMRFVAISTGSDMNPIQVGQPIYVFDTKVGTGLTSTDNNTGTQTVGIGTTFVDNIYTVAQFTSSGSDPTTGIITCCIAPNTNTTGLSITGSNANPVGKISLGKISGFAARTSPISIGVTGLTIDSGLTTFPTLKRDGGSDTFEQTGSIFTPL